jgi:hypothetical protein
MAAVSCSALVLAMSGSAAANTYSPITVNQSNWSGSTCCGAKYPALIEDSHGVVHLQGALRQTSPYGPYANLLGWTGSGSLFSAYAPPGRTVYTIVHTGSQTYADLAINSNGEIWLIPCSTGACSSPTAFYRSPNTNAGFVSLEGVSYVAFPTGGWQGGQITTNWPNWNTGTPQYNFGASSASWWEDNSWTVHLSGGVQEVRPGTSLIGWLPSSVAPPAGPVYTLVHTLGGTYAKLSIDTYGGIWLIPIAGNTNPGFVSLEGITYSRLGAPSTSVWSAFKPLAYLNTINWLDGGYGATTTGWYRDADGFVHLEGGVKSIPQSGTFGAGGWPSIGTLPEAATPTYNVFTIVHTLEGFADLMIGTDGRISLIALSPYDTSPGFVSLDGVTFLK